MSRLEKPIYDSTTGEPLNKAALESEEQANGHCDHWKPHGVDTTKWIWCHQCQRYECLKCQHEEM